MKLLAIAALAAGMTIASAASASTVVFNEDFSGYTAPIAHGDHSAQSTTGNGIQTGYSYRVPGLGNGQGDADSMYDEGTWTIAANPFATHNLWVDLPNNTNPMLMLNGMANATNVDPAESYTSMTLANINVASGTYAFSYDLMNLCCNANGPAGVSSFLRFWYSADNGATFTYVPGTDVSPAGPGVFANQSGQFTLATGGILRVGLVDSQGALSGNDFGIDNIRVTAVPEPMTWALMIMGFGGVGAVLRRRRSATAFA